MAEATTPAGTVLECPICGMAVQPGQGYRANEATYCCRGCAEGAGCTCPKSTPHIS